METLLFHDEYDEHIVPRDIPAVINAMDDLEKKEKTPVYEDISFTWAMIESGMMIELIKSLKKSLVF